MTEQIVHEWLVDYGALSPVEVHSFASSLEHNQDLVAALYTVLEERNKYQDLIPPVCSQLFVFYRSREVELQRFTLQFLPTLIFVYLNCVAHGDKKSCRSVETLLMGLYNLEVVDEKKEPKVISFRLPSLAQGSIYHEPMSLAPASLTESALRRLEECNTKLVNWGPLPQVENLNAQNRLKVMTALLFVYNQQLSLLHKSALMALCKVSSKLVTQGFNKPGHHQRSSYGSDASFVPRLLPRIPVSSQFLLEFVHAVYYAMFNEFGYLATQALEDIYTRGCYESYAEVVLVTSAIRNSLRVNPSGQPSDGPMGISVALSPATTTVTTVSKSMITNASFRTKKLPDDLEEEFLSNLTTSQQELMQHSLPSSAQEEEPVAENVSKAPKGGAKWRSWTWKHNTANKGSIDEEEPVSPTRQQRRGSGKSIQDSPTRSIGSNKHSKSGSRRGSSEVSSPKKQQNSKTPSISELEMNSNSIGNSPKKRSPMPLSFNSSPTSLGNRMSAGARLCKVFEESLSEEGNNDATEDEILQNDIPIQVSKEDGGGDGKSLMAITEEQEESPATERLTPRGSSLRGSGSGTPAIKGLPKLPTFPGLGKKAKDKETKSTTKNGVAPDKKDGDPKKVEKIKDGSKVLTSRGSVLSVVLNGDATDGESSTGSARKKGPIETSNGPFSLEANTNGSMNSTASLELEKMSIVSDSLTTNSNIGGQCDSQLQFTGDSVLPDSEKTEMPLIIKKMDGDRLSMQVSSV